jgi:hypothetical protein
MKGYGERDMDIKHDRRRYPRRRGLFSAKYTVKSGTHRDLIRNVSAGGVFIATRHTISNGERISLQFPAFAFERKPSVIGLVVRIQDNGFAVMFNYPVEGQICPDDRFYSIEVEQEASA